MQYDFDSATKRLREELGDPLLKVVYDVDDQEYQVLKWVQTGCGQGYYIHQMSCDEWDNRVIEDMKKGHWRNFDLKTWRHEQKLKKEKAERERREKIHDKTKDIGKDIWNVFHPKIYSTPGEVVILNESIANHQNGN